MHPWHGHKLVPNYEDNGWKCDGSAMLGGCRRGITDFNQTTGTIHQNLLINQKGVPRFRCGSGCDYGTKFLFVTNLLQIFVMLVMQSDCSVYFFYY